MNFDKIYLIAVLLFACTAAYGQDTSVESSGSGTVATNKYKFAVFTPWLSFSNFGNPKTNTHHYEILVRRQLSGKDAVGIKVATWKLFAPMGIPLWNAQFLQESAFYPGRLRESGVGITYQRRLWKGVFAALEVLPLLTTYLDEAGESIGSGFKLYSSYHLGYHVPLFKTGRFFIEPQVHLNYWPVNTNVPQSFKREESKWNNYFFLEPNLYLGMKF
ncbi:hypothetical protein [Lewinella sp. JB7]|uniref:hypothetical protein n=1 Tax=Lewinella sp. JB7 TaxID=2962887 RepID=UPI0020C9881F|nr:hypothetical protein [Lewinella sp. JB7]MCP9237532.1 hypothetical protein [Lewinella sp. JB7]